jgi:hypothetical protein
MRFTALGGYYPINEGMGKFDNFTSKANPWLLLIFLAMILIYSKAAVMEDSRCSKNQNLIVWGDGTQAIWGDGTLAAWGNNSNCDKGDFDPGDFNSNDFNTGKNKGSTIRHPGEGRDPFF